MQGINFLRITGSIVDYTSGLQMYIQTHVQSLPLESNMVQIYKPAHIVLSEQNI